MQEQAPRLLDQVRARIRFKHYSIRTEQAYIDWIRRFIKFNRNRHPVDLSSRDVEQFLTHLASVGHVAASTQNQAQSALLFLYREVLSRELPWLEGVVRAKTPSRLPVVLTRTEVAGVLTRMRGTHRLIGDLLYGTGMRIMEALRLRVKDVDCENKNIQYSVPCTLDHLGRADRDLEGVRKCLLHAVWQAQGQGCAPGALGVCIGSDRAHGYELAKEQLFRTLDDVNPVPELAKLETEIMDEANKLGVGAMGFGGKSSLIGCKITAVNRLPASFFVSVAYECWAFRRLGVRLDATNGAITNWLYRDPSRPVERMSHDSGFKLTGREVVLTPPLTEAQMRALKVGDVVLINGEMFTGRDNVHAHLMKNPPPRGMHGSVLYHCGPVMLKQGDEWVVKAAGPTTSMREEPYQAEVIRKYGVRAVIGKGGMGAKTLAALKECGAVYLNGIGGAAQFYARTVEKVLGVELMEFGIPEAMWHLRVNNFVAIVTMDAHGNSLHADVESATGAVLETLQKV